MHNDCKTEGGVQIAPTILPQGPRVTLAIDLLVPLISETLIHSSYLVMNKEDHSHRATSP